MIIQAAVSCSDFKKSMQILLKSRLQFLAMPTSTTTDVMSFKFFPDTMQLLKSSQLERFVNQIEIERILINDLSSCNTHQLKNYH